MAVLCDSRRPKPVRAFLDELTDADAAAVVAAMQEAAIAGLDDGRRLRGDIYELRVDGDKQAYRAAVRSRRAPEPGAAGLGGVLEEDPEDPPTKIDVATRRLADWRARGTRR